LNLQKRVLEKRYEIAKSKNNKLTNENFKLNQEIKKQAKKNRELLLLLDVKVGKIMDNKKLHERILELEEENNKLKDKIEELEEKIDELKDDVEFYKDKIECMKEEKEDYDEYDRYSEMTMLGLRESDFH